MKEEFCPHGTGSVCIKFGEPGCERLTEVQFLPLHTFFLFDQISFFQMIKLLQFSQVAVRFLVINDNLQNLIKETGQHYDKSFIINK